jgi:hypothetical protein
MKWTKMDLNLCTAPINYLSTTSSCPGSRCIFVTITRYNFVPTKLRIALICDSCGGVLTLLVYIQKERYDDYNNTYYCNNNYK